MRSRRFARLLRGWMRHTDHRLAAYAAGDLATMGLDADIGRLVEVMESGSWLKRDSVARGVANAMRKFHASRRFRATIFDAMALLLAGPLRLAPGRAAEFARGEMIEAMQALDGARAAWFLTSEAMLRPDSRATRMLVLRLHSDIEEHPKRYRRPIDAPRLWRVFDHQAVSLRRRRKPEAAKFVRQTMGYLLCLAADGDPERASRECREILRLPRRDETELLRALARQAVRRCRRIPEPHVALSYYWKRPERFSARDSKVMQAYGLIEHVQGDGLLAYLVDRGQNWRMAHVGLLLIGATGAARILQNAARIVEMHGRLSDERSAMEASLAMSEAESERVGSLGEALMRAIPRSFDAIQRYISKNQQAFPTAMAQRLERPAPADRTCGESCV
ncbi:MAG: hypothetical protein ACKVW3_08130 [Phycisphaerales bacterium]